MSSLVLPHAFDTTKQSLLISWVLLLGTPPMAALGLAAPLYMGADLEMSALMQVFLPLVALSNIPVAFLIFRSLKSAQGSISPHMIMVRAGRLLGVPSGAPEGTFTPSQFSHITHKRRQTRYRTFYQPVFSGRSPVPDLLLEPIEDKEAANSLMEQMGARLGLPVERIR